MSAAAAPAGAREPGPDAVERRAIAYLDAMPPAISHQHGHNAAYAAAVALVHGFGLSPEHALGLLGQHYNPRCQPPWSEKELRHKVEDAAAKPHSLPFGWLRDALPAPGGNVDLSGLLRPGETRSEGASAAADAAADPFLPAFKSVRDLLAAYPELRRPVIHGLLRQGETMNVIAPPKMGKSWLVTDLALAIATGTPWLGLYETAKGQVLILDNELHGETSANRIPKVAAARGVPLEAIADTVFIENLRGHLRDLFAFGPYFRAIAPGRFQVVILDAFYRFIPKDTDENDNASVAQLHNHLDHYAQHLGCSFILIHHSTKGNQSAKSTTDVGAGAGSQSRATDAHLILRAHEEDGAVVLDAAVRSWPPIEPMGLRWHFPVFDPDFDLDPTALRPERGRRKPKEEPRVQAPVKPPWDADRFVAAFVTETPRTKAAILEAAEQEGLSERKAERLLRRAEGTGRIHRWRRGNNRPVAFATTEQGLIDVKEPSP